MTGAEPGAIAEAKEVAEAEVSRNGRDSEKGLSIAIEDIFPQEYSGYR